MQAAINTARTDVALRGMTDSIRRHFDTVRRRMRKRQRMWGGDLSVIDGESAGRSNMIRRSLAFSKVMREMPIIIEDSDIITGSCAIDDTVVRCALPIYIKNEELGLCSIQMSHKCPDYETLLSRGLRSVIDELKGRESEARAERFEDVRTSKLDFIEACTREAEAVIAMANRYADLAEVMAEKETDAARKAELTEIAKVCRRVPEYPAASFHEAIQSVWFFNYAMIEVYSNISIGRIDQVLNPFFETDWKAGRITLARAQDLVDSFVLHVNDRAQIDPTQYYLKDQKSLPGAPQQCRIGYGYGFVTELENDNADAINHWGQNILISGLNPNGTDATNALTYLFLNSHEKFSMTAPVLTVRMHKNTPAALLHRAAEVLKTGGGMPYINNDDIIVSAYEKLGVPRADGCRYANSNCWETLLQGMCNQEMIRGFNFLYFLELAVNRGQAFSFENGPLKQFKPDRNDPMTFGAGYCVYYNITEGVDTGDPANFASFEELVKAWKLQLDCVMSKAMEHVYTSVTTYGTHGPLDSKPILSALTQGCVENLTDLTHMGAKYNLWHLMGEAVSNAADSLAAIKKFVYEEKLMTLPQLVEVLKSNWDGEQGETLRMKFINEAPKFGHDDDYVDGIARELVDYFLERAGFHAQKYPEIIFSPCIGTYSWIISIGKKIGASAEGRKAREPIAANMSPVPGRDVSGPTAAIRSYLKVNTSPMAAGAPVDLRVSSGGLEGEEGTKRVEALIKTFLQQGGNMLTLTVTSAEELRKAIAEPDNFRGLRVRMGGWSAYFTLLSKASQEIHLRRVEHGF
jgi:formate C-acetyltransferase